jgi:hypothetical protein
MASSAAWAERLSGTYFFGGSGMNGPYVQNMVAALHEAGIENVTAAKKGVWSNGSIYADGLSVLFSYERDNRQIDFSHFRSGTGQFNLVGYSYGSILVAQIAADYADSGGTIDNLVLIASPIHSDFLKNLIAHQNIKRIHQIRLTSFGDDMGPVDNMLDLITVGMKIVPDIFEGMVSHPTGHFALCRDDQVGKQRLNATAKKLYDLGMR